ncbi:MAG: efflux RND transporter periplasmic adaptor subunit [Gammaproteobacteria bacterium]
MSEQKKLLDTLRIEHHERHARELPLARYAVLGAALLLVAAAAWWAGSNRTEAPRAAPVAAAAPATPSPAPATTSSAAPEPSAEAAVLSASGYITARRNATVASRITGQLTEVLVEEGMPVAAGDVLARLDERIARNDLQLAEASERAAGARVNSAAADLAEAERVLKRVSDLEKASFASEATLTEARAGVERLRASLATARAEREVAAFRVQGAREQLDLHVIRAPFAGIVTVKTAQPGEVVSPMSAGGGFTRTGICTVVDMESLEIEVDVNETYIGRVREGQSVTANLDAWPDWDIPARVVAIIPSANREKATVRVRIGLETRDPRILPDMGVKVAFLKS